MSEPLLKRITLNPEICHGKPCIQDLRYPVEFLLELLRSGMTVEEILVDYDDLTDNDIQAALLYVETVREVDTFIRQEQDNWGIPDA